MTQNTLFNSNFFVAETISANFFVAKMIYAHFFVTKTISSPFFVAKTIFALCPESFCAYKLAIKKIQSYKSVPKKNFKLFTQTQTQTIYSMFNRYGKDWMVPCEFSCPEGSEYVWLRRVGSV